MLIQILAGLVHAAVVSFAAHRLHALTSGGAVAATVLGTVVFGLGGWQWAALLLAFFILSSALSRLFQGLKRAAEEKYAKGSERDEMQVLSNGGLAGIFVLLHAIFPQAAWTWIGFAGALSTIGIAVLLLFSHPRPAIGLFSLFPAMAGTMLAYFIFSLFHKSISILVLGFGGAIISFTVDQGIAYLLFLDRPHNTFGKVASAEVWDMTLLAVLTTLAAFGTLCFSGFPVFVQLGQFTMLGLGLCFVIVHAVFPRIFPVLPPGGQRSLHLQKVADALARTGRGTQWTRQAGAPCRRT